MPFSQTVRTQKMIKISNRSPCWDESVSANRLSIWPPTHPHAKIKCAPIWFGNQIRFQQGFSSRTQLLCKISLSYLSWFMLSCWRSCYLMLLVLFHEPRELKSNINKEFKPRRVAARAIKLSFPFRSKGVHR